MEKRNLSKILFIKATFPNSGNSRMHPLGIMSLASVCRERGNEVSIFDTSVSTQPIEDILSAFKPDIVGISALTVEAQNLYSLAKKIKMWNKNTFVITGGPHATHYPHEVLEQEYIDYVVLGEGEASFPELVKKIETNKQTDIPGTAYKKMGEVVVSPISSYVSNLDDLPFPAWDLIEFENYSKYKGAGCLPPRRYASIFTSRGCPYKCIYCHQVFGKKFRVRSPEKIIEEIELLIKTYNVYEFDIVDDVFNLNNKRVREFCTLITEKNIKINLAFPNGLRTDILDEEILVMLKTAGTQYISFAIETATERIQQYIKKYLNLDKVKKNIDLAHRIGIHTNGFFMFGFPTESKKEVLNTIKFAINSKLTTATFFVAKPTKGTELWEIAKDKIKTEQAKHGQMTYSSFSPNISDMDLKTLKNLYRYFFIRFYCSPLRIWYFLQIYPPNPFNQRVMGYYKLLFKTFFKKMFIKQTI